MVPQKESHLNGGISFIEQSEGFTLQSARIQAILASDLDLFLIFLIHGQKTYQDWN